VRRQVVDRYGAGLVRLLDAVSARLTTGGLTALNRQVAVQDRPPAAVAAAWLRAHRVT
jgi:glycine betaine/choline ABC-type transport system substrate-binding protein